ncbi:hypothetical protein ABT336_01050 [Micromonospora sp. NPDC000207]|uniref:hypothetical protein n=1 Tax=Micromonospora sp. NPDC000207 TaxID=3154246 RepID=UPI0033244B3C
MEPPKVSWKRAKRVVASATAIGGLLSINSWDARSRWVYGSHNNERRVRQLRSTKPHGFDPNGDPWYSAVLYPAPPDPIYGIDNLVGLVAWLGHIGCLWPGGDSDLMLPLVRELGRESRHFVVPVFFGVDDESELSKPTVLLPHAEDVQRMTHQAR